jgi:hypothetical protein
MTPEKRWARLDPFAEHIYAMAREIRRMPTDDLKKLRRSIARVTQTNCSWAVYAAAKAIKGDVQSELRQRTRGRRK